MDKKTTIFGIPVTIVPTEEIVGRATTMVAMRKEDHDKSIADGGREILGTKSGYFCVSCEKELVLAPSGQMLVAKYGAKWHCMQCAMLVSDHNKEGSS